MVGLDGWSRAGGADAPPPPVDGLVLDVVDERDVVEDEVDEEEESDEYDSRLQSTARQVSS